MFEEPEFSLNVIFFLLWFTKEKQQINWLNSLQIENPKKGYLTFEGKIWSTHQIAFQWISFFKIMEFYNWLHAWYLKI